jgi:hypothetical protein
VPLCVAVGSPDFVLRNIEVRFVKGQRFNQIRVAVQKFRAPGAKWRGSAENPQAGIRRNGTSVARGRLTCGLFCNGLAIVDIERYNWKRAFLAASSTGERITAAGHDGTPFFRRRCDPFLQPTQRGKALFS